jgi:hypothetical protein
MVSRLSLNIDGLTDGVVYFDVRGAKHFQRAHAIIVCRWVIEPPRLLLNSACPGHEMDC